MSEDGKVIPLPVTHRVHSVTDIWAKWKAEDIHRQYVQFFPVPSERPGRISVPCECGGRIFVKMDGTEDDIDRLIDAFCGDHQPGEHVSD